jgi:gliding motility-associated lipoprotein GldD
MKQKKLPRPDIILLVLIFLTLLVISCNENYIPRPRGYFRIDTPEKAYVRLDSIFPYSFEYPVYTRISSDLHAPDQPYWINIEYPQFKGKLHISYKLVKGNLTNLMEDTRTLVLKHIPKATSIEEEVIHDPAKNLYGIIYEIKGPGAASPYQFFITDSTRNFLRAALYFDVRPNNDSLAPVIDFIKLDIRHMIDTFYWKDSGSNNKSH